MRATAQAGGAATCACIRDTQTFHDVIDMGIAKQCQRAPGRITHAIQTRGSHGSSMHLVGVYMCRKGAQFREVGKFTVPDDGILREDDQIREVLIMAHQVEEEGSVVAPEIAHSFKA